MYWSAQAQDYHLTLRKLLSQENYCHTDSICQVGTLQ
jgi:hypothetical protein